MMRKAFQTKLAALLLVLFLVFSVLPVSVFATAAELSEDAQGNLFVDLPASGSDTLDLSDKDAGFVALVYDDGGASGSYSDGADGSLTVTVRDGCRVRAKVDVRTEQGYDFFCLYDGAEVDQNTQLGKYSGSLATMTFYSSANVMTLRLTSDGGLSYDGVKIELTVIDPAELVKVSFEPGEGSGSMDDIFALPGEAVRLPACTFTLPENTFFDSYTDGENTFHPNDSVTVTGNLVLTAVYVEKIAMTYDSTIETQVVYKPKGSTVALATYASLFSELPYRSQFKQWRINGNAYAAAHQITLTEDITITAEFTRLPIIVTENREYGDLVMLPRTGDVAVDLTDKPNGYSLGVFDDHGFNYYSNNCSGSLTFTAPEGYIFLIGGEGYTGYYGSDYLTIYDTDLETKLGDGTYGDGLYTGSFTVPDLRSTGNKIRVSFRSDNSGTNDGFELRLTMVDPDTLATVSFLPGEGSGSMESDYVIKGESYTIPASTFSEPYDGSYNLMAFAGFSDGVHTYIPGDVITVTDDLELTALYGESVTITYYYVDPQDGCDYTRTASAARGASIRLPEFDAHFSLPYNGKYEFLGWLDGASEDDYAPGSVYTVTEAVTFTADVRLIPVLVSDGAGGWYANMSSGYDTDTVDVSDKQVGFTFKVYDDGGKDGNYSNSCGSYLVIRAPEGTVLKVTGTVTTEYYSYDYLTFYDGLDSSESYIGDQKYGSKNYGGKDAFTLPTILSSGNAITIYFRSDYSTNKEGFDLTVTIVEPVRITYVFEEENTVLTVEKNASAVLKAFEDLFELPYGKEFVCWKDNETSYAEGASLTVAHDTTLTAVLALMPTITLDGSGAELLDGSGETATAPYPFNKGTELIVPHAKELFELPSGKVFGGWQVGETVYETGEAFVLTEDVVAYALWLEPSPWDEAVEALKSSGTFTLTDDLTGSAGSLVLTVPEGVTVTLDLAGHTVDGAKTAAVNELTMILVKGSLTITDSVGGGAITGGGIEVRSGGTLELGPVASQFKASVENSYYLRDFELDPNNGANLDGVYSVVYYHTLCDALYAAAEIEPDYEDELDAIPDHNNYMFGYNDAYVKMLDDAQLPAGDTWEINSDRSIWFDLNGRTFTIDGTFTGGVPMFSYIDGVLTERIYPSDFHIVSTVPGTFCISGNIEVSIQPWTQDTYIMTGGVWTGFFADGGTYQISGGTIRSGTFNNGNQGADLTVELSGDAVAENMRFVVYSDSEMRPFTITASDRVRFIGSSIRFSNDGTAYSGNKPVLTINGAYFDSDPRAWLRGLAEVPYEQVDQDNLSQYYVARWNNDRTPYDELDDYYKEHRAEYPFYAYSDTFFEEFITFASDVEAYAGQADWAVEGDVYAWRVGSAVLVGDFDGSGEVNEIDRMLLSRYLAEWDMTGYELNLEAGDINRDGFVTAIDRMILARYLADWGEEYDRYFR